MESDSSRSTHFLTFLSTIAGFLVTICGYVLFSFSVQIYPPLQGEEPHICTLSNVPGRSDAVALAFNSPTFPFLCTS